MTTVIQNGTIVTGGDRYTADLLIEGEIIRSIGRELRGDRVVDASGCLVFPGFIDGHTHLDMPVSGTVTADDFTTGSIAALLGGTTTLIDFATQEKDGTLADALALWHRRADHRCSCDYGFHMAITDWNARTRAELHDMALAGVTSFKAYLAYDALMVDDAALYEIACEMKKIDGILGVHCENGPVLERLRSEAAAAGHTEPVWHARTRPSIIEGEAVGRFLRIAALADVPAWVVHLSTEDGLTEVRMARARGQKVFVETCPQYLTLDDSVYAAPIHDAAGYVCSPPLRPRRDQRALWGALTGGEIDILSTDHCSFDLARQKARGRYDFRDIPNGLPGIEHRPVVMYTAAVASGRLSPSVLCRMLAETPARMFGLYPRKGVLAPGSDADVVIYDPTGSGEISALTHHQNCDYTPYEGFQTAGRVRDVFLRGTQAVQDGRLLVRASGKYLMRARGEVI